MKFMTIKRTLSAPFKVLMVAAVINLSCTLNALALETNAEDLVNFNVTEEGVYQVTYAQLKAVGLELQGESLNRIALMNNGRPVNVQLRGSSANATVFGAGASIRFVAKGIDTLYTDTNVYTLRLDSDAQVLITSVDIPLAKRVPYATSYLEKKKYAPQAQYSFASPDAKDPWYAKRFLALRKPASDSISMVLDDVVPGGNNGNTKANMKMNVWGGTDLPGTKDDHHIKVKFNGQTLVDETFDGFEQKQLNATVPIVKVGPNTINIELPLDQGFDYEAVNLNSLEVNYPRAFVAKSDALTFSSSFKKFRIRGFSSSNIVVYRQSAGGQVSVLSAAESGGKCSNNSLRCSVRFSSLPGNARYYILAESQFKSPEIAYLPVARDIKSGQAEYLIITHPDFVASAGEADLLGALANDLRAQFNSVDIVDVEQIYAQFSDHVFDPQGIKDYITFAVQNRATKMVLFVGGDIYDYRGFENKSARSFIPSIYVATDDIINFAPVDAKYVDLDNNNTPDLPIGRLPVRTMAELEMLLNKRTAFKNRNYAKTAIFAADGFDDLDQYSFKLDAQSIEQDYFQQWNVGTAYTDDHGVSSSRQKIVSAINQGVSLTSFFGHSSTAQWTFNGLFNGSDAANLQNVDKPTIVTQWGCWNTYFVNPNEDSMGHRFMMEGNRGAVSVLGATTLTSATNEKFLARLFFDRLTKGESLGEAMTNAKNDFVETKGVSLDVILGWTLLGFPELEL